MRENEKSLICTGGIDGSLWYGHLSHLSEGNPGSVGFPYKWVMEREESKHDVNGFWHTHPGMSATPSLRDYATMHQWVMCFGKPLMCLIEGVDGLKAYLFYDDESPAIQCRTVKQFGQLIVVVLPDKKEYNKPAVVDGNLPRKRKEYDLLEGKLVVQEKQEVVSPINPEDFECDDDELDDILPHILDWDLLEGDRSGI